MRKVITEPSFLGSTDIGAIELDAKSRDDIRVHRNKGTWRDIRSASIIFARSLVLIGDSEGGFPSAFALKGPACAPNEAKRGLGSSNKGMRSDAA